MGTIDDTLAPPLRLPVDGNLARTMPDAHLAARRDTKDLHLLEAFTKRSTRLIPYTRDWPRRGSRRREERNKLGIRVQGEDNAATATQSAWVKLCNTINILSWSPDAGISDKKEQAYECSTQHERLDGQSGKVLVSAAVQQADTQTSFVVQLPRGVLTQGAAARPVLPPDMRVVICSSDAWEKAQENENIDECKLKVGARGRDHRR